MAIGTTSGAIKVFGQPGVEFYGHHTDGAVTKIIFIPNQGRLVSLCDDNSLHLWEINDNAMTERKSTLMEGKLNIVSVMCIEGSGEHLLLGTEGGNIYKLAPDDYKKNPGAVEALAVRPDNPDHLLIAYNRGLMVLWFMGSPPTRQTYISTQGVESVVWCGGGGEARFYSSHNDGRYLLWGVNSPEPLQQPVTPHGPFPSKAITKILTATSPKGCREEMLIFSGGMPRASYGDRHTISVIRSDQPDVSFDFTSKVIDFFVVQADEETTLIALAEEELVAIQLDEDKWPSVPLPYLVSLHTSSVTCSSYVSCVPEELWGRVVEASSHQSQRGGGEGASAWPVDGGRVNQDETPRRDMLLTGHEDGSVRLWDASSTCLVPMYKFCSTDVLCLADDEDDPPPADSEDSSPDNEWPPFKKVGSFDPYSDDPRLAVKKVNLCPLTGTLVVAGTAGYVIIAKLIQDRKPTEVKVTTMNIVSSRDGFVWKGEEQLSVRNSAGGGGGGGPGFQATCVLQLQPPAQVTALAHHSAWGLVAAGTAHGMALYDYVRNTPVAVKCTLNPNDLSGAGDAPISRRKSFKKSLRESFRRLRKGRSQRQEGKRAATTPPRPAVGSSDVETKPVERAVEARPVDDALGSMVRCLTFARTYIISVQNMTPTLWAGTNNGTVYVFTIAIPGGTKRTEESVSCQLGKEIQLKHRAPVIGICLIDGACNSVDSSRTEDHPPPHRVLICSEEQIKLFTVPALKPVCKLKLTAGEGARVRRTALAVFRSADHVETCLMVLTNLGDVIVLALPDLRRQVNAAVVRREDINGISSLVFTEEGEALYLQSSSELERVTLSCRRVTRIDCGLDLAPGARPADPALADSTSTRSVASSSSSSCGKPESRRAGQGEIKENGVSDSASGHDMTLSSVGDITIDSVKDHLVK
ncbi:hypothetical protein AAG570_004731 [Ranatra chinensis]|uniref:Lethal giant larvae homologue 2 domain-containing protein n=1 Tax=Ranatra chinensis TaxID=642074 RepID=A0ABD0Y342_9HEMI